MQLSRSCVEDKAQVSASTKLGVCDSSYAATVLDARTWMMKADCTRCDRSILHTENILCDRKILPTLPSNPTRSNALATIAPPTNNLISGIAADREFQLFALLRCARVDRWLHLMAALDESRIDVAIGRERPFVLSVSFYVTLTRRGQCCELRRHA